MSATIAPLSPHAHDPRLGRRQITIARRLSFAAHTPSGIGLAVRERRIEASAICHGVHGPLASAGAHMAGKAQQPVEVAPIKHGRVRIKHGHFTIKQGQPMGNPWPDRLTASSSGANQKRSLCNQTRASNTGALFSIKHGRSRSTARQLVESVANPTRRFTSKLGHFLIKHAGLDAQPLVESWRLIAPIPSLPWNASVVAPPAARQFRIPRRAPSVAHNVM
jgi:hypothetical protein